MTDLPKIAIVTGSNKGIGYAIVKGLCEKFPGIVYLTARDVERGLAAINELNKLGFYPKFHQLDVTNKESINKLVNYLKQTHGKVDLLINNAAICYKRNASEPFGEQAEVTLKVNYFSTLDVSEAFFPILKNQGQIINISSSSGHLSKVPSQELRSTYTDPNLTIKELNELVNQYIDLAYKGEAKKEVWGSRPYVVSKVAVSALTRIHQREHPELFINSVHPGYVDTDMTDHEGVLTIEQGAVAPLFLSLEDHNLKGQYIWFNKEVVDWLAPTTPPLY